MLKLFSTKHSAFMISRLAHMSHFQFSKITKLNLLHEKYAAKPHKQLLISTGNQPSLNKIEIKSHSKKSNIHSLKKVLMKVFFPRDYPNSVKDGYLHYTKYTFLVGILINLMDFLSTQVLINSMGISKKKSMKLSAGLNWVIKDGIGQFCSIFFATKYNSSFEQNLKQWRVLTLMIFNIALFGEILCMKVKNPYSLLLLASLAQSLKMCATFGNVSARVGIMDNFCNEKNISDLQNKSSAQSNLAFAIGTLIGMGISLKIPLTIGNVSKILGILSSFYMIFGFKSIEHINIPYLNFARGNILFRNYIKTGKLLSMKEVNKLEGGRFMNIKNLHFSSCSLDYIVKTMQHNKTSRIEENIKYIQKLIQLFKDHRFMCLIDNKSYNRFELYTVLQEKATNDDIITAFLYSVKMHKELSEAKSISKESIVELSKKNLDYINKIDMNKMKTELILKDYDLKTHLLEKRFMRYNLL